MTLGRGQFNVRSLLVLIAVVVFVAAAIGFDVKGINLLAIGLALGFASFLL